MGKWYLIMTKPHKDSYAEEQLNNQGYTTYRPLIQKEKNIRGKLRKIEESLFPRYLFIQLEMGVDDWSSIRSTRGVLKIIRFGTNPTEVPNNIISVLKKNEIVNRGLSVDIDCFKYGDKITIESGAFAGLNALFDRYKQGGERVMVLLNILNNIATVNLAVGEVKKVA